MKISRLAGLFGFFPIVTALHAAPIDRHAYEVGETAWNLADFKSVQV